MRRLPAMFSSCLMIAAVVACASTGGTGGSSSAKGKSNPDVITTAEIDAGNYRDAYDVVQRLRPTWFTKAHLPAQRNAGVRQRWRNVGRPAVVGRCWTGRLSRQHTNGRPRSVARPACDEYQLAPVHGCRDRHRKITGPWIFDHHGSDCRVSAVRALIG